ncbi:hypothetical protein EC575_26180, partial [Vibrio cholerae]
HTIIIGDRSMDEGHFEYKNRRSGEKEAVAMASIIDFIHAKLA